MKSLRSCFKIVVQSLDNLELLKFLQQTATIFKFFPTAFSSNRSMLRLVQIKQNKSVANGADQGFMWNVIHKRRQLWPQRPWNIKSSQKSLIRLKFMDFLSAGVFFWWFGAVYLLFAFKTKNRWSFQIDYWYFVASLDCN